MSLIALHQVSKDYTLGETRVSALKNVTLKIEEGEFGAIWGPSGSGKSTLCNLIGLLDTPTSGQVFLWDQDVNGFSDNKRSELRNATMGFIFQNFNLIPVLSAVENVMLPLEIRGESGGKAKATAIHHLTQVGLATHLNHRPSKLSGGQQQRVAIARALVCNPAIVIADEPTANLDSETALALIDLMHQLNQQYRVTFLFSTHDQRLLQRVQRRIFVRDGSILEDSSETTSITSGPI